MKLFKSFALFASFLSLFFPTANASDEQKPRLTLEQKADTARGDSIKLEQLQLDKARQAAKETAEREDKIRVQSQSSDWEEQQKIKTKKQFDERESREQKYLREAKDAATKERKIPKP
ncbi:hypothetical protein L2744_13615 [Shewanella profunda]|uniref:hypothetical protein n=1 Tax=Shewanella profunda TaxID=254793 RepID=UPI00200C53BF|nr:hypothetical protein [Shewanella profunda]MCL1090608.1 hypothetical protein [Shewanella profunda]